MTPKRVKVAVDVFAVIVVASVGLALAGLSWRIAGFTTIAPAAAPAHSSDLGVDIKPILALSPFGSVTTTTQAAGDSAIRLKAIFMALPVEESIVLIAGADGKTNAYGIGQDVGGGIIESIESEQIVLRTPDGQRIVGFSPDTVPGIAGSATLSGPAETKQNNNVAPSPATVPPAARTGVDAIRSLIPPSVQGRAASPTPQASPSAMLDYTGGSAGFKILPMTAIS